MRIEAVIAINKRRALGLRGALPWKAPRDMRHFKELTTEHIVVMGRKTFDSIGRALPNRENVVVTRSPKPLPGVVTVASVEDAFARYAADEARTIYVIGGAQIFDAALPWIQRVHLTVVDDDQEGDVYLSAFEHRFIEREVWIHDERGEPKQVFKRLERAL
jgi:dihydrofolate reductase